jgi:exopolyphosphatase/guanosine-5'-triphosphate,3'-diphosphate pyrophosphatase
MDPAAGTDIARQRQMLVETLRASRVLPGVRGGAFYAVGGAWRALARIDMQIRDYPLKILHHYVIPRAEALTVADFVARQSRKSLERLDGAAGSRAETLPHAANLLAALIEAGDLQKVVISAFGLREGALFARMTDAERSVDPMVAGAAAIAGGDRRMRAFAVALDGWIAPAFTGLPELFAPGREALIRRAACHLADLGARLHPDHRGDLAFELVLRAPYAGLDHAERAFLALCAFHRYSYRGDPPARMVVARLLDEEQRARARAAGAAMRLGADLSGRSAGLLATCALKLNAGRLTLEQTPAGRGLVTDQVRKRLTQLAAVLGLEAAVS